MPDQITQLINFIKDWGELSYDSVKDKAREINPEWRPETWTRGLRRSNIIKQIYKDNKPNSPVIAYRLIKEQEQGQFFNLSKQTEL